METFMSIINWVKDHYLTVIALALAIVAAIKVVTTLTKSTKDDEVVGKIENIIIKIKDFFTPKSK